MIERQPQRHQCAPVVPDNGEPLVAQHVHQGGAVVGHGPLGVPGVIGAVRRFGGLAITAQIGADDRMVLG